MNFNEIEKLEDAPKKAKMREGMERNYRSIWSNYPWKKIQRFLHSRLGKTQDEVSSEFLKLNWLPKAHRTIERFKYHVETHTFLSDDGDICYFDSQPSNCEELKRIRKHYSDVFYIHPVTKVLCFHQTKKVNWTKIYQEKESKTMRILGDYHQLLKLNGIWYEVKGEIVKKVTTDENGKILTLKPLYYKEVGPRDRMIPDYSNHSHSFDSWRLPSFAYSDVKITYLKQLNSKELKKFNLTNDGPKIGKA